MQRPMVLAVIPLLVATVRHGPGTEVKILLDVDKYHLTSMFTQHAHRQSALGV